MTQTRVRKTYDYPEINVFEKASFSKCRSVHTEAQSRLFKGLQIPLVNLKSVFEKFCFGDGLVWTVGPNRGRNAAFSDFSVVVVQPTLPSELTGIDISTS